jgi:predicted MFS family arabinose efflux permease
MTLREAWRTSQYFKISAAALLFTISCMAIAVHMVPILRDSGLAAKTAAITAGAVGLGAVIGRLTTGLILDRVHGSRIGMVTFSLPIVSVLILLSHPSPGVALIATFILGVATGSELDIVAYVSTRYFGLRHLGAIFGTIIGFISLGAGVGPWLAGFVFDGFGSYYWLMVAVIPAYLVSAVLIATLGPYPPGKFSH